MAARFLGKTSLAEFAALRAGGLAVLEQYERIRGELTSRLGAAYATFLAEPVITWGSAGAAGSVSWYADALGEAEPLHTLPADRRSRLEANLRSMLAGVEPLLAEPDLGPLLRAALVVATKEGVRAVDDHIVLIDWGLAPQDQAAALQPRELLAASVLGSFLAPPAAATHPAAPFAAPPPISAPAVPVPVAVADSGGWRPWFLPTALIVAAAFLILGIWLGTRMVAARLAARPGTVALFDEAAARQAIERQKQENAELARQVEARRKALEGNVCVANSTQIPGAGPDQQAPVPPAAVPPPQGHSQFQGSLADLLKQGVVMVLAKSAQGLTTGSGFFVTPDLIVTNRHVVEKADANGIMVTNAKLGRVTPAHLLTETPSSEIGQLDVALLKLDEPAPVQPLAVTTTVADLDPVVAAGFPGVTLQADESFDRLLHGDANAVPAIILTDGKISAIQETQAGVKIMPHTAAIAPGNSGGPLVDACGRVVGINTFVAVDQERAGSARWAEKIDQVIDFATHAGIPLTAQQGPCVPTGAAAPPASQPAQPGATPPPAAPPPAEAPAPPAAAAAPQPAH